MRFDKAQKKMKEIHEQHPELLIIPTISEYTKRIYDPLSPIYDSEISYIEHLEHLEKLLEKITKKEPIIHYGEIGLWRCCVKWQNRSGKSSTSIKEEVTCKRCKRIMGWT